MVKKFDKSKALAHMVQHSTVTLTDGRQVKIRSMLMKEYKMLMLANESKGNLEDNFVRVLRGCVVDGPDLDLLPIFDLELLYLHVWRLSKGTYLIPIAYRCGNTVEKPHPNDPEQTVTGTCGTSIEMQINLNTVKLPVPTETIIKVSDEMSIEMRYPTIGEIEYFEGEQNAFNLVMRCVHKLHLPDEVYEVGVDVQPDELTEILEYVDEATFIKLATFIRDIPRVTIEFPVKCPVCGHVEVQKLVGINDFFV